MNRQKALTRRGRLFIAGIFLPLIIWAMFSRVFPNVFWSFSLLVVYWIWLLILGRYIKRMLERINRDYPKEEENSNEDNNKV